MRQDKIIFTGTPYHIPPAQAIEVPYSTENLLIILSGLLKTTEHQLKIFYNVLNYFWSSIQGNSS